MIKNLLSCKCSDNLGGGALFAARLIAGVIFFAHGYQKLNMGIGDVAEFFALINIPFASFFAYFVTYFELIGGVLLIAGLLTHWVSKLFVIEMVVAFFTVHVTKGIFVSEGGFEFVAALFAIVFVLMALGPGKFAVDNWLKREQQA